MKRWSHEQVQQAFPGLAVAPKSACGSGACPGYPRRVRTIPTPQPASSPTPRTVRAPVNPPLRLDRRAWLALGLGGLGALGGCAAYSPRNLAPGAEIAEILARMGPATARYPLEGGVVRLEFARGPMGLHTYMLDVDGAGRLLRSEQVLTEAHFLELRLGMTAEEVRRRIGTPSSERYLPRQRHRLWSYRYETPFCIWFQVSLNEAGQVAELGHNADPRCDFDRGP